MRLRSFHGKTMADAMTQVRENLGDDAIIVATREDKAGLGVRVTAAIEEIDVEPATAPFNGGAAGFAIRDSADIPLDEPPQIREALVDILMRHSTPGWAIDRLVSGIGDEPPPGAFAGPNAALAAALDSAIAFNGLPKGRWKKAVFLTGPYGAGKTSTCAKLAARAVLKGLTPAVLTTDLDRAGGTAQLDALTKVMNIKLVSVEDPDALADAIATVQGADQVIVDGAGRNPFDSGSMDGLESFLADAPVEPVLVQAAGGDPEEAAEIARAFKTAGCGRMIATRLDTTRRLASVLTAALGGPLALADFADTAAIADGLKAPSPTYLANRLVDGETTSSANPSHS